MIDTSIHNLFAVLATGLLHSVWLFALLSGIGHTIASNLRLASHRYLAYLLALLSLPVTFAAVLFVSWRSAFGTVTRTSVPTDDVGAGQPLLLPDSLTQIGLSLTPAWTDILATAYLLGLTIFAGIRIYQYSVTLSLRASGRNPDPKWLGIFYELRTKIVPGKEVGWKVTNRVRQVLVVGVFRPVILFPIGLLATLTPAEVEAVLLHELYHVRRYDAFWNALQLIVVSLFFYHPVVYWLSRRIDREREYVCDDAASAATEPTTYARALVRLAKFSLHPKMAYTMSAIDDQTFTHRIRRLFGRPAQAGKFRSSFVVPLALLPLCLLLAFAPAGAGEESTPPESAPMGQVVSTTVSGSVTDADTGEPLIGTSIIIQGTSQGTVSDLEGNFTINMPDGAYNLVFYYTGYQTSIQSTQLHQEANKPLYVQLAKDRDGTEVGKAPSSVSNNDILKGLPGNVLLIINGKRVERSEVNNLDRNNIEKIDVIKDKAKLGELGYGFEFDGAILITTKE